MSRKPREAEPTPEQTQREVDREMGMPEQLGNPVPNVQVTPNGDAIFAPQGNGAKPKESKADRFKRLANRRVPLAIFALKAVANLANQNQYEYTPEQRVKIIDALTEQIAALKRAFNGERPMTAGWSL